MLVVMRVGLSRQVVSQRRRFTHASGEQSDVCTRRLRALILLLQHIADNCRG